MFKLTAILALLILVYGLGFRAAWAEDGLPSGHWTVSQAITGLADDPERAEEALRQGSGIEAKLYLALLLHLRDRDNPATQEAIRRFLANADRDLESKSRSGREYSLAHFQALPAYDGTTESLGQQLRYFGIAGESIRIPCKLMRLHPDLYAITAGVNDRMVDRSLPGDDCERSHFPELAAAFAFWDLIDAVTWEPRRPCGGTITRDYANGLRVAEDDLLFGPAVAPRQRYSDPILTVSALGLDDWSRVSLWNWEYRKRLEAALDRGAVAVAAYYQAEFGMSPEVAEREARIALLDRVFYMPAPELQLGRTLASAILEGEPAERIHADLASGELALKQQQRKEYDTTWQGEQEPPLMLAVTRPDVVQILLQSGADPAAANGFGKNALMTAAQYNNAESIALLLKSGVDVNARTRHPAEIPGNTAAFRDDIPDDVYDQFQHGCGPVKIRHGERTALMYAAANGSLATINALIEAGANIEARDNLGRRAVHYLIGGYGLDGNQQLSREDMDAAMKVLGLPTTEEDAFLAGEFDPRRMMVDALLQVPEPDITRDAQGRTALYWAAKLGYAAVADKLSQNPARLHQVDLYGEGPLHAAIDAGRADIVRLLLNRGADPNLRIGYGRSPLRAAIDRRSTRIVTLLLGAHANVNEVLSGEQTILTYAVRRNQAGVVDALVNAGAPSQAPEQRGYSTLGWAVSGRNVEVVKRILQDGVSQEDLIKSFEQSVTNHNMPVEIVHQLLAAGADPNHRSEHYGPVLHMATIWANSDIARLLVDSGAKIDAVDKNGSTALHDAARGGNIAVIEDLVSKGASVNVKNNGGETPLMVAARHGKTLAVEGLLAAGANLEMTDKDGQTALDIAQRAGNEYVVDVLLGNARHR